MAASKLDANQCIKHSYDDSSETLKVSITAATTQIELDANDGDSVETRSMAVDATNLLSAASAASNQTSVGQDILKYSKLYVVVQAAGLDAADGTVVIQGSIDNSVFVDVASPTVLGSGNTNLAFNIDDANYKYFRVSFVSNTNTAGTITADYVAKG